MTTTAENPTEEVDQPEVSPEPAGLEIEFCGEIYKVDPGKTFTIGRVGSLAILSFTGTFSSSNPIMGCGG